jgi:lysophospholipase L1-like esterase
MLWAMIPGRILAPFVILVLLAGCSSAPDPWELDVRRFEALDSASPPPRGANLFIGSSSIRLWKLEDDFPGYDVVNRGFGGSHISDCVRLAPRIAFACAPRVIVFYAGDNDIAAGKRAESVRDDFASFVKLAHEAVPVARIIFISIKPSPQRWALAGEMRRANALILALANADDRLEYVDVWPPMLGAGGEPRPELYVEDKLHMSREGYRIWADLVRPWLARAPRNPR